jgi:hypothetical protein
MKSIIKSRQSAGAGAVFLQSVVSGFFLAKFHKLSGAFVDNTLDGESTKWIFHTKTSCRQKPFL